MWGWGKRTQQVFESPPGEVYQTMYLGHMLPEEKHTWYNEWNCSPKIFWGNRQREMKPTVWGPQGVGKQFKHFCFVVVVRRTTVCRHSAVQLVCARISINMTVWINLWFWGGGNGCTSIHLWWNDKISDEMTRIWGNIYFCWKAGDAHQ